MGKGNQTREAILDEALAAATELGMAGLSIGELAKRTRLSKSGLYAHFESKENLQIAVLEEASRRFIDRVMRPALLAPRGEPRLRVIFENWLGGWEKAKFLPGGCVFIAVTGELDDRPGPVRDFLVKTQLDWLAAMAKTVRLAVEEGHFHARVDPEQTAFELQGLVLTFHYHHRLLRDPEAEPRLRRAFEDLIQRCRA